MRTVLKEVFYFSSHFYLRLSGIWIILPSSVYIFLSLYVYIKWKMLPTNPFFVSRRYFLWVSLSIDHRDHKKWSRFWSSLNPFDASISIATQYEYTPSSHNAPNSLAHLDDLHKNIKWCRKAALLNWPRRGLVTWISPRGHRPSYTFFLVDRFP